MVFMVDKAIKRLCVEKAMGPVKPELEPYGEKNDCEDPVIKWEVTYIRIKWDPFLCFQKYPYEKAVVAKTGQNVKCCESSFSAGLFRRDPLSRGEEGGHRVPENPKRNCDTA